MKRINNLVLIAISATTPKDGKFEADKNGNYPVWATPVSGIMPNKALTIGGTVAAKNGFEVGKSYLAQVTETEPDQQYGRKFNVTKLKEVDAMEIVDIQAKLGEAQVIDVTTPVKEEVKNGKDAFVA